MPKSIRKTKQYAIAEAKDQFARIVHEAESGTLIEITRRNEPVAALISMQEYQNIRENRKQFWDKLKNFLEELTPDEQLQPEDLTGLRDSSAGRMVRFQR